MTQEAGVVISRLTGVTAGATYQYRAHLLDKDTDPLTVIEASSPVVEATAWTVPGKPTGVTASAATRS